VEAVRLQLNGADAIALAHQRHDLVLEDRAAIPRHFGGDGLDGAAGVRKEIPSAMKRAALDVAAECGLDLARLIAGDALHLIAMGLLRLPLRRFGEILRLAVIDAQRVLVADEVRRARGLEQRLEVAHHAQCQIGARRRDGLDPVRQ
jgi:hypothetical protein